MADIPNLPSGGVTNHFGHLVDNIYSAQEKNAANLVNSIYDALIDGTPRTTKTGSPADTGALKANWHAGTRPNTSYIEQPKDRSTKVPLKINKSKTYGINVKYFIWNNTPYLQYVNAGIVGPNGRKTDASKQNIKFIEAAIDRGTKRAVAKESVRNQPFF